MNNKIIYLVFPILIFSVFAYTNNQLDFDIWQAVLLLTAQTTLLVCFAIFTFMRSSKEKLMKSDFVLAIFCILTTFFLTAYSTKYVIDIMVNNI
jgi:predicted permease